MAPDGDKRRSNIGASTSDDIQNGTSVIESDAYDETLEGQPLRIGMTLKMTILHLLSVYGFYHIYLEDQLLSYNTLFCFIFAHVAGLGVSAGVHRFWSHRSYRAKLPLRLLLALLFSMSGQYPIPQWVRDHRTHHKYSDTIADPHNPSRGFFFAHMGWLLQNKHPAVLAKGKQIDISDVTNDPVVQFHTKYFMPLTMLFCFILPMSISYYVFQVSLQISILSNIFRYLVLLHYNWLINSAAHRYGYHPYNRKIRPSDNLAVSFLTMGEGWHNYHHVFPWDYKSAELGNIYPNVTKWFIDTFAFMGLAYDLKSPSPELVAKIASKNGDGSRHPREVDDNGKEVD